MSRQIDALKVQEHLTDRMVKFACRHHFVRDAAMESALAKLWSSPGRDGGLCGELWVEGAFPSESSGTSLEKLAEQGAIHKGLVALLDKNKVFPKDRAPFSHQLESLNAARAGYAAPSGKRPAIIVSAGTGAGKTESFLLPLLDDLLRHPVRDPRDGVSAIILYPMNALVNDQVDRLVSWLKGQQEISVFHFTGDTPETIKAADLIQGSKAMPDCALRSRQQARGLETAFGKPTPENARDPLPRILITNYSMLEYMLCRPQDHVFFGKNLRSIVLDEAHLYTGNLAAEISLLLRRVCEAASVSSDDLVHYATSATLGDDSETGRLDTRRFAARLFGKSAGESATSLILGRLAPSEFPPVSQPSFDALALADAPFPEELGALDPAPEAPPSLLTLPSSDPQVSLLRDALRTLAPAPAVKAAEQKATSAGRIAVGPFIRSVLLKSPLASALDSRLRDKDRRRASLGELARDLLGSDSERHQVALRRLLTLGALARDSAEGYPLLPNRVHLLISTPEGVEVSWDADAVGAPVEGESFKLVSPVAAPEVVAREGSCRLTLVRDKTTGEWLLAGYNTPEHTLAALPASVVRNAWADNTALDKVRYFKTRPDSYASLPLLHFHPESGNQSADDTGGIALYEVYADSSDGHHDANKKPANGDIGFFTSSPTLYLSTLAHAALMEMPVYPEANRAWKPAEGRRLLLFSDNRRSAALLGTVLTSRHEYRLFRAALAEVLAKDDRPADLIEKSRRSVMRKERALSEAADEQDRADLEDELTQARADLATALAPREYAFPDLFEPLRATDRLKQLFHRPTGDQHRPGKDNWTQRAWEDNAREASSENALRQLLAYELGGRAKWPDLTLETLALVEVVYPGLDKFTLPAELAAGLPAAEAATLARLRAAWPDFLADLLDSLRTAGVVTFAKKAGSHSDEDKAMERDYPYGVKVGQWVSLNDTGDNLLPLRSSRHESGRHHFAEAFLRASGLRVTAGLDSLADRVLAGAFAQLREAAPAWLESGERETKDGGVAPAFRIRLFDLKLRRPLATFRCATTHEIRVRSTLGVNPALARRNAPTPAPTLEPIPVSELDTLPHLGYGRTELLYSSLFRSGLWADEHSAQLAQGTNRNTQDLFKEGIRNILSATTTLEMGIDIGGLQGVLLANVPPGKANYLQRAGRAGRRADGSSLVLGFVRPSPYEREIFLNFGDFLERPFRKPTLLTGRDALVLRHLHAFLFARFFRAYQGENTGAMNAYKSMGFLTGVPEIPYWSESDHGDTRPQLIRVNADTVSLEQRFRDHLDELAADPDPVIVDALRRIAADAPGVTAQLADAALPSTFRAMRRSFDIATKSWRDDYAALTKAWEMAPANTADPKPWRSRCNAIMHQAGQYHSLTTIEVLANGRFFPRYGFPIGINRLRVAETSKDGKYVRTDDRVRLERESSQSLREYVPGATLLVGGKYVTSHGLLKHWSGTAADTPETGLGFRGRYLSARDSNYFDYSTDSTMPVPPENLPNQPICGDFLIPRHGFTSAAWDEPTWNGEAHAVGKVEAHTKSFHSDAPDLLSFPHFAEHTGLAVRFTPAGEILALNGGEKNFGFAICPKCGFADSEIAPAGPDSQGVQKLPKDFEFHRNLLGTGHRCAAKGEQLAPPLRRHHLGARFQAPLALFSFAVPITVPVANTLAQALRLAGCGILELDTRELGFLLPTRVPGEPNLAFVLYDTASGGAGHIEELVRARASNWIAKALQLLAPPAGLDEKAARRAVIRRILTADSPRNDLGEPAFDPLDTYRLLVALRDGTPPPHFLQDSPDDAPPPPPSPPAKRK